MYDGLTDGTDGREVQRLMQTAALCISCLVHLGAVDRKWRLARQQTVVHVNDHTFVETGE